MQRAIDIGKLNKRVTFQRLARQEDAMGQDAQAWEDVRTVWADFYPVRGGEYQEEGKKKREEVVYKAKLRYFPGVDASMRVVFRGRQFLIGKVTNVDEANYKLELECTEFVEKTMEGVGRDG